MESYISGQVGRYYARRNAGGHSRSYVTTLQRSRVTDNYLDKHRQVDKHR
ncbi:hypothetical protein [Endozoicomonas sp. ONNA2]|nr:hypothetical protein [Endozoicomonas sp. ONNA2]